MALRRLSRKILLTKKRNLISVFVLAPQRKVITLVMRPADKILAVKLMIKERLGYPCAQQRLTIGSRRTVLRDDSTLEENRVYDYATIELFTASDAVVCNIRILPANRVAHVKVSHGAAATVREVRELVGKQEGQNCDALYQDDQVVALSDDATIEDCNVPEHCLVWVQGSARPARAARSLGSAGEAGFEPFTEFRSFLPRRTDPGPLESDELCKPQPLPCLPVRRAAAAAAPQESTPKVVRERPPAAEVGRVVAADPVSADVLAEYERNLALVLDENSRVQFELSQLRGHLQEEVSLARGESKRIREELTELQTESARQLSKALDDKESVENELSIVLENKMSVERQLSNLQSSLQRQLDAKGELESEAARLERELGRERERALCAICLERPRDTMVFSCLHFHFCSHCLEVHQKRSSNCPSCRGFISGKLTCNVSLP